MTDQQKNDLMAKFGVVAWGNASGEEAFLTMQKLSKVAPCTVVIIKINVPFGYSNEKWEALVFIDAYRANPEEAAKNFVIEWCKIVVEDLVKVG